MNKPRYIIRMYEVQSKWDDEREWKALPRKPFTTYDDAEAYMRELEDLELTTRTPTAPSVVFRIKRVAHEYT